jgi:ectoine hydroxylase-related dioxygenase (phytanoyl-CoA dioxygenase family)
MTPTSSFSAAVGRDGFAIVPGIIEAAELDTLVQNLQHSQVPRSRAGIRHAMRDLNVASVAGDERLLELARGVLGSAAFPFRATLFDKSPDSNWLVVWHQDTALPLRERCDMPGWGPWSVKAHVNYAHAPAGALEQVLALRLHLDDSTADNGPLRVLPATHTLGVLSDKQLHDLSTKLTPVDCLVPRGGVIAMRPLAIHASSKSQSERRRRVLHIEYAATPVLDNGLELAIV